MSKYFTRKQVAEYFNVSVATIYLWEKKHGLPVQKNQFTRPRYLIEDVQEWYDKKNEKRQENDL